MPIPALNAEGLLPEGVHDCTLDEIRDRFGAFQRTDHRCRLFERLERYVAAARASGLVVAVIVDGSFVTAKDEPSDVDVIVVLRKDHDFRATLRPMEYNVVASGQIRRMYRVDAVVARSDSDDFVRFVALFSLLRDQPDARKGMVRIRI
jgi:predicted nucleotidyltransferase